MLNIGPQDLVQIYPETVTHFCLCQILNPTAWANYTLGHSPSIVYVKLWSTGLGPNIPLAIHPLLFMLNIGPQGLVQIYLGPFTHYCLCLTLDQIHLGSWTPGLGSNTHWNIHMYMVESTFHMKTTCKIQVYLHCGGVVVVMIIW